MAMTENQTLAPSRAEQLFDETIRRYNQAFDDRDLDRFMSFFHEDAVKIDSSGAAQWNKQEITELFRQLFAMEFTATHPAVKKVVQGGTAVLVTEITLAFDEFTEHFLTALTYTAGPDGEWRVLVSASTDLPA
jgi:uncharacterized protein (TIGR02246 family)